VFHHSLPQRRSTISASVDEGSVVLSQLSSNDGESLECSSEISLPSSCDSEELLLPSTDDEETLSQCREAQVSVAVDDRNEIPNVDAAMLLTQCSDPGEAVLVAQCSGGHVAQTTGGVPGDNLIGHTFLTDESEALLNLQVFVNNSDQSVVDPRYFWPMTFAEIGALAECPSCINLFVKGSSSKDHMLFCPTLLGLPNSSGMQLPLPSEEASCIDASSIDANDAVLHTSIDADDGVSHSSLAVDDLPGIETIGSDSSSDVVRTMNESAFNHASNGFPKVYVIPPSPMSTITTRYVQVCFILLLLLLLFL
jgi:hypothetical protein